ncbi:MAG: hypothetical protein R3E01_33435 [Pirellulaceae bacterium]
MSTTRSRSILLLGGPEAGKSNYLGRLWLALQQRTGQLASHGMPTQVEYLNSLSNSLLQGEFVARTSRTVVEKNSIPVQWSDGEGTIFVPDCSGEAWNRIHRQRSWSDDWESAIPELTGCVLFVRAGDPDVVPALDWATSGPILHGFELENSSPAEEDESELILPTQVVLVDWLNCLLNAFVQTRPHHTPLRLAVVVSAWDVIPLEYKSLDPARYIDANFPLVHDFLSTNLDRIEAQFFGLSVAGGDFQIQPDFQEQYLAGDPNHAGYVITADGNGNRECSDATLPAAWALRCDEPNKNEIEV